MALKLILIERFDISTMILIEVCESIVKIDWWMNVDRNCKLQLTFYSRDRVICRCWTIWDVYVRALPLRSTGKVRTVKVVELTYESTTWKRYEVVIASFRSAVGVVDADLLDLSRDCQTRVESRRSRITNLCTRI